MKHYKLIDTVNDALKLQDEEGNIITAFPNEVVYYPESNSFVVKKKRLNINYKEIGVNVFCCFIFMALVYLMMLFGLQDEQEGYYRASNNNNDGIHYEWVEEGGDK